LKRRPLGLQLIEMLADEALTPNMRTWRQTGQPSEPAFNGFGTVAINVMTNSATTTSGSPFRFHLQIMEGIAQMTRGHCLLLRMARQANDSVLLLVDPPRCKALVAKVEEVDKPREHCADRKYHGLVIPLNGN